MGQLVHPVEGEGGIIILASCEIKIYIWNLAKFFNVLLNARFDFHYDFDAFYSV